MSSGQSTGTKDPQVVLESLSSLRSHAPKLPSVALKITACPKGRVKPCLFLPNLDGCLPMGNLGFSLIEGHNDLVTKIQAIQDIERDSVANGIFIT